MSLLVLRQSPLGISGGELLQLLEVNYLYAPRSRAPQHDGICRTHEALYRPSPLSQASPEN